MNEEIDYEKISHRIVSENNLISAFVQSIDKMNKLSPRQHFENNSLLNSSNQIEINGHPMLYKKTNLDFEHNEHIKTNYINAKIDLIDKIEKLENVEKVDKIDKNDKNDKNDCKEKFDKIDKIDIGKTDKKGKIRKLDKVGKLDLQNINEESNPKKNSVKHISSKNTLPLLNQKKSKKNNLSLSPWAKRDIDNKSNANGNSNFKLKINEKLNVEGLKNDKKTNQNKWLKKLTNLNLQKEMRAENENNYKMDEFLSDKDPNINKNINKITNRKLCGLPQVKQRINEKNSCKGWGSCKNKGKKINFDDNDYLNDNFKKVYNNYHEENNQMEKEKDKASLRTYEEFIKNVENNENGHDFSRVSEPEYLEEHNGNS